MTDIDNIIRLAELQEPAQLPPPSLPMAVARIFLAERYILYARDRDRLFSGRVHHRPYPLQAARSLSCDESLLSAAGIVRPSTCPLAHFAAGVDVEVFPLLNLEDERS